MEIFLLIRLLTAHFLGDFILQPDNWVEDRNKNKIKSKYLYLHSIVVALLFYLFSFRLSNIWIPLFVFATHLLIDIWKSYKNHKIIYFIIDQLSHIMIILIAWVLYQQNLSELLLKTKEFLLSFEFWIIILAYIIITIPAGVLVAKLTKNWRDEISKDNLDTGLSKAGTWIGSIERILIITFIFLGHIEAIGFLIAAKSVFRFAGNGNRERQEAEYILIGTMLSFLIAIIVGYCAKYLLSSLPSIS